ncbi:MAG: SpoIIE family protein phosphatase [Bdellovibrionaceae bacterium]|nr:SpoIIE family protein phosphatase [Pseudobdellovibrionaceae bacterium]
MAEESEDKERIRELESELSRYRAALKEANARLEEVISRLSEELRLAAGIQKLLSPTRLPRLQGFEFSSKFVPGVKGGDYFDIFEHEDNMRFGILMASSTGYAMSALFMSVLLQVFGRIEARRGLSPEETIRVILEKMRPEMPASDRASLFYAVVDRRKLELRYCSAGSITSILLQKKGTQQILEAAAPALSQDFNAELQGLSVPLCPGDKLVLASEGVVKTLDGEGRPWGLEGLREALRISGRGGVHDLRNEVLFRNEKYSGKQNPDRDLTVVVVEVQDNIMKLAKS